MPKTKKLGVKKVKKEKEFKVKKVKKEKEFKLEAHFNDIVFKHEGDTLLEAVQAFVNNPDFPFAVKTKVFLKYGRGDISMHKLLNLSSARTIFKRLRFDEDQTKFLADKLTHELTA